MLYKKDISRKLIAHCKGKWNGRLGWLAVLVLFILIGLGQANNTAVAAPSLLVNTFPYNENFDGFATCSTNPGSACTLSAEWSNATDDDIDWTVDNGGTPSSGTGPAVDHTTGTASGNYLYTESSFGMDNKQANLISPQIDLSSGISSPWLSFWYHMYGSTMGTLHIDVSTDDGANWTHDIIPAITDNQDLWQEQLIDLSAYAGESQLRIRFRGMTGSNWQSDMAIDDVSIFEPTAGINVETPWSSGLTLYEGGVTQTYEMGLWTIPAGNVDVTIAADSQSEISLDGSNFASSQTLTFNSTAVQTVTIRAIDDATIEGGHSTTITQTVSATADPVSYPLSTSINPINANIYDNDFDSDGDKIADAYDSDPLDAFLPGTYGSVIYQTTADNEDNIQSGNADGDLNSCVFNTNDNHPIEFNIFIDEALPQSSAYLSLFVEDVDWPDEVNEVFLNGHSLGYITGEDEQNYSTLFVIPDISWLRWGQNIIQIDVDQLNVGNWCAQVNNAQIVTDYQGAEADANVRSMSSDAAVYAYSDPVTIDLEVDTTVASQTTRLELILRDPDGTIIDFDTNTAAHNWVINGSEDEPYQWQFNLPASGTDGFWAVTLTVYDEASGLFQDTRTVTFAVPDTAFLQPTVTSITPDNGDEAQQTAVSISGSNFDAGTTCTVGGVALNSLVVVNNTTITAVVPNTLVPAAHDVVCTNSYGSDTLGGGFTVNDVDIAAVLDLNGADAGSGFAALFTKATSPISIVDSDLTVTDTDSVTLTWATATLINFPDGTDELLAVDVTGTSITAVYSTTTGVLTLDGPDTIAHFEQVMRTTTYANAAIAPDQTNRVVAFVVHDGDVDSNTANSVISIGTPMATDDNYNVAEDGSLNVTAPGVLDNDVDGNGEPLTAVLESTTSDGTLNLLADGSFNYAPDENFCGTDSFTYHATDGTDASNTVTGTITVTCTNDAPVAVDDTDVTDEDTAVTVELLNNDDDIDGDDLTITAIDTTGTTGDVTDNGDGTIDYDPNAQFEALDDGEQTGDSFAYTIGDGHGASATATVTMTITGVNDAPLATPESYDVVENVPLTINAPGVLANDSDVDDEPLTAVLDTQPVSGTVSLNSDGSFTFTPAVDVTGTYTFSYHANDGDADSETAVVTLNIQTDTDGDGQPDLTDTDDDNDGQTDVDETSCGSDPLNAGSTSADNDGDGSPDCVDADDDNDGTDDGDDAFPFDPTEDTDSDGDGTGDNADTDDDNDGQSDADESACGSDPLDAGSTSADNDGDGSPDCVDADDDNDGTDDGDDAFPFDPTEDTDTDGDGTGDNADTDDDNDGQSDADETACGSDPLDVGSTSADNDGDNSPDCVDADDDNDGTDDGDDAFPFDPTEDTDTDGDGIGDNADTDDDNDGQSDSDETSCGSDPLDAGSTSADNDGDNIPDCVDPDDDNDGTDDGDDAFPFDPTEDTDTDGDGTGDNADTDDDNDGQSDSDETSCGSDPLDAGSTSADNDGDNIPDCADPDDDNDGTDDGDDAFPFDPTEDTDTDGDGTGDNADTDDDNDGTPDGDDAFPLDPTEDRDTDGDGTGDNADSDDDNDGTPDGDDAFPLDPTEDTDTDGDGTGNNADSDDDNDGQSDEDETSCGSDPLDAGSISADNDGDNSPDCVDADDDNDGTEDGDDAFPFDPTEDTDTDGDGTGDNADTDDDNDGQTDGDEVACGSDPLDAGSISADNDGDGSPDCVDADDDNDGTEDGDDAFPFDPTEDNDHDDDGTGDNADTDDDNDGQTDVDETACGSDPLDAGSTSADNDGDGSPDCVDADDDNDGTEDGDDAFPFDPTEDTDTDGDGTGDNADTDDDNDGQSDADETACGSNPLDAGSTAADNDGDGSPDCVDADDDNDGTDDGDDAFPFDPTETSDNDGDGTGDNADTDDDNDGQSDADETACGSDPLDAGSSAADNDGDDIPDCVDSDDDNDGTPDGEDAFPFDDSEDTDTDGDGTGDNADTDDDNDGQSDVDETACGSDPLDAGNRAADNDGDNIPDCIDSDDDNDGTPDDEDAFPLDPTETSDNDGDGIGDNADTDDDNDGTPDDEDAFPFDPTESNDNDGDGTGDNADTDDDNDGQSDVDETACGSDPMNDGSLSPDHDGDDVPDCVDDDDDNDGTPDDEDDFPFDDSEDTDTDGDGTGDNADSDDDNDGQSDADENSCGSNPLDNADTALDSDGDNIPDCVDNDDDNDGTPDDEDDFPTDPSEQNDHDGDGIGDNADDDDDNDGLTDVEECPNENCRDSDGDEIPDYLDDDDDGDGVLTAVECDSDPCADADGDNVPDYLEPNNQDTDDDSLVNELDDDDDGDGIPTAEECPNGVPCPDTDGDSIPDYLDHNAAPTAVLDESTVAEDGSVLIDVLNNDSDPNNDAFSLVAVTQPAHGTAVIQGTSILYTPNENYFGADSFTYTINDGVLDGVGIVNVNVTSENDAPVAQDDEATTERNTAVIINVLDNDSDPIEGSSLTVTAVDNPTNGTTSTDGTSITYTPDNGFVGTESFNYTMSDGEDTVVAKVTVTVEQGGYFTFLPMVIK